MQQAMYTSMVQFPALAVGARPAKPVRMAKPSDAAARPVESVQDRSPRQRSVSPSAVIASVAAASTEGVATALPESPTHRVRSVSPIAKAVTATSFEASAAAQDMSPRQRSISPSAVFTSAAAASTESVAAPLHETSRPLRTHSSSPTTTGADASSRSPRRKSDVSNISAEDVSFPAAAAAASSFSATYDSDGDSDYEKPIVCSGKQMDIRKIRGSFKPGLGDALREWHFNTALTTLRKTGNLSSLSSSQMASLQRDCEKGLVEASEDRNRFPHEDLVELVGLIRSLNVPVGHVHFGNAFATCDELIKDRALRLKQTVQTLGREIRELEDAKVKSLRSYGDCGGKGEVSPRAGYGMGPKFEGKEVESHQQLLAKVYSMDLEDTVRK